jgi:hypothetical protein
MNTRRKRFHHSKKGLAANLPWGVYDTLARTWVIDPERSPLSKECAESRASAMNLAARGGGYQ